VRPDLHERRAHPRLPAVHPAAGRRPEAARCWSSPTATLRLLQHLPHAQGRLRPGRAHQPLLLRAAGHYLGVTPQDIIDYDLEDATHPLEEADIKRAKDALKNDPFIRHHKEWQEALKQMLKMGVRIEQQAFAKHGLNFVLEHLPAGEAEAALYTSFSTG
jgi:hypothetical protein